MKKLLLITLSLMITLGISGCGGSSLPTEITVTEDTCPITIKDGACVITVGEDVAPGKYTISSDNGEKIWGIIGTNNSNYKSEAMSGNTDLLDNDLPSNAYLEDGDIIFFAIGDNHSRDYTSITLEQD